MNHLTHKHLSAVACAVLTTLCGMQTAQAATAPPMGTAANFGVLGGLDVTNTGSTNIVGDVGVFPGAAIVGFPPGTVFSGTTHGADAVAQQGQTDLTAAYLDLAGQPSISDLSGQDLGGKTLVTGVYSFSSSAQLTGTLTLDAQGVPGAVFIFQVGSTLTTASGSRVQVINGGSECNVYWQVGTSATVGTGSTFGGNILALTSISLTTGATVAGRALARNGSVTLDTNNIAACQVCGATTISPSVLTAGTVAVAYNQVLSASGATAPYTFDVVSGSLPNGLTLSAAGVLAGTPTASGTSTFTVNATDSTGCFGSRGYTLDINAPGCASITLAPTALPAGTVALAYNQAVTAAGGTQPYVFSVASGALPPGITVMSGGATTALISGTPTTAGVFNFTLTATDASSCAGSQFYTVSVGGSGSSLGDPHMNTADGLAYEFQACGDFVLTTTPVGSSRVDLQACKLEYSIVSPK